MSEDLFGTPIAPQEQDQDNGDDDEGGFSFGGSSAAQSSAKTSTMFDGLAIWPPYANPELFGMDDIEQQFLNAWHSGKFPHGIALTGTKGIGKSTLAFRLARFILHNSAQGTMGNGGAEQNALFGTEDAPAATLAIPTDSKTFTQSISGGHPDLLAIGDFFGQADDDKKKSGSAVEDIRKIPVFLRKTAAYGGWRVVIVDDADMLNSSSQNALLKILEEPPKKALIILVTHRLGAMLPTIKSRIRVVKCQNHDTQTVKAILKKEDPSLSHDALDLIAFMASGSIGRALSIQRDGGAQDMMDILAHVASVKTMSITAIAQFCEALSGKDASTNDKVMKWREAALWLFHTSINAKARGIDPFAGLDLQDHFAVKMALQSFMDKGSVQDWLNGLEHLNDHFEECDARHLDNYYQIHGAIKILRSL